MNLFCRCSSLASLLPIIAGCSVTQIVVYVDADADARASARSLEVVAELPDGRTSAVARIELSGDETWPLDLSYTGASELGVVQVVATATDALGETIATSRLVSFVEGESRTAHLFLSSACAGVVCAEGSSCGSGFCAAERDGPLPIWTGAPAPPTPDLPAVELCAALTDILCRANDRCCSRPEPPSVCDIVQSIICATRFGNLASDPLSGYDGQIAIEVVDELAVLVGECRTDLEPWLQGRLGMRRAYRGTVDVGADCTPADPENTEGAFASCIGDGVSCVRVSTDRFECAAPPGEGAICVSEQGCAEGTFCNAAELCAPKVGVGGACSTNVECDTRTCATDVCVVPTEDDVYCL